MFITVDLPEPLGAHQRHKLAGLNGKIHAFQRGLKGRRTLAVGFGNASKFNQGGHERTGTASLITRSPSCRSPPPPGYKAPLLMPVLISTACG